MEEKRKSPRIDTKIEIVFREAGSFVKSYMINVSDGGIFIKTDKPLPLDSVLALRIQLPDDQEKMKMEGMGKCGLVLRLNEDGDGYYLSLDLFKGLAQIRAWRYQPEGGIENAFHYQQLQAVNFVPAGTELCFSLVAYEQYLEFSLNDHVQLTLADDQFSFGKVGFYAESARIRIEDLRLDVLHS